MIHALLVLLFCVPIAVLFTLGCIFTLLGYILGGQDADGGLAGLFLMGAEGCVYLLNAMRTKLTTYKPVALTFNGAVRYWRKNLAIARDVDSKNWEHLANLKRYAMQNLPEGFDYGTKPNNSFHKQFRFSKYVIGKRKKTDA